MTSSAKPITIRDLCTIEELNELRSVEKDVWGMAGEDAIPLTLAIALKASGNIFIGAFEEKDRSDKEKMVGFAFGFLGHEHGETTLHSHMLAVLDEYRHLNLGAKLKYAQRERALTMGVREMTWTFDPLQSRNAHFNFAKLGVLSETYKVDFYGPETSSKLHRNGTDRLWVRWMLSSRRVLNRIAGKNLGKDGGASGRAETLDALRLLAPLVRFDGKGKPARSDLGDALGRERVSIEIPGDILAVEAADMGLAREWREATRWAFLESMKAGFFVSEFCRSMRGQQGPGAYLLQKGSLMDVAAS
jgi:predicted GNAT superfamily acetyltransferase